MKYDNIVDARTKLQGTMVYYHGKAALCRAVDIKVDPNNSDNLVMSCRLQMLENGQSRTCLITDPGLKYMEFNIGYINSYQYATWFCRMPYKQYRQGLRNDQVEFRDESGQFRRQDIVQQHILSTNRDTAMMLENNYPTLEEAQEMLKSGEFIKVAFHRDFALFRDKLRGDYVLEHKGIPIAFADLNNIFKCSPEYKYLRESMQEIKLKVA
jgi:hypothetical protein